MSDERYYTVTLSKEKIEAAIRIITCHGHQHKDRTHPDYDLGEEIVERLREAIE